MTSSADKAAQADNITMSTGGLYSLATKGAKDVIDAATPMVLDALRSAMRSAADNQPLTLTDMGCADGGTSLDMVRKVIAEIRQSRPTQPIQIVYADQPRNDFNALTKIVHGLTEFDAYIDDFDDVHVFSSGTSFYRQIVATGSLNLGFSATAMHWLSRKPADISDHVHATGASGDELAAFADQAKRDWETILRCRARELGAGGKLVFVNFCRDEAGRYLGATGGINMFDTFNALWQDRVDNNIITRSEYTAMTLPQYYPTVEEFSAPFQRGGAAADMGLTLDHIETRIVKCPFAEAYKVHGDAAKFAAQYIPTIRSWNESIYFAGLDASRPLEQRHEIIRDYYQTYQHRVAADPDGHAMDYVHAYMVMSKA